VRCAPTDVEIERQPAQLDPGADRTVIPVVVLEALGALPIRRIPVAGLGGHVSELTTYLVNIVLHDKPPVTVEVLGSADETFTLLGRDILNRYRILFDGPNLMLEIT
jgi:predicted aspartyl protease